MSDCVRSWTGKNPPMSRRWKAHRAHERYLRNRHSGMEPWIEFWAKLRYALEQIRIEWSAIQDYREGRRG